MNPGPVDVEIKNILESFRKEMVDRFEKAERKTEELHGDWKGLKNEVNVLGSQMQEVKKELVRIDTIEKELRSRNVVIYGIDSKHMENKYDTIYRLMEILINQLNMRIDEEVIDNCFWLGRRNGRRPLLVKFTRVYIRDEVLNRSRLLKGSRIWVEQDYDFGTIKTRRELLPYLREARRNGKRATLRGNKLKLENQLYDLEFCRNNLKKDERDEGVRRRSRSQDQQEERGIYQVQGREWRARSHSPRRRSGSQRELQLAESPRRSNELRKLTVENATDGSRPEVNFRVGESARVMDQYNSGAGNQSPRRTSGNLGEHQPDKPTQWSNERRKPSEENAFGGSQPEVSFRVGELTRRAELDTTGNLREDGLQTISSDSGSILRVNRGYRDVGSYFLRAGTSRRK